MLTASRLPHGHEITQKLLEDWKILERYVGRKRAEDSDPHSSVEEVSRDW
jgi:hypothetical protein